MAIKLVISDFDGVLLDLKEIHFEALNRALKTFNIKYVITPEEHVRLFDGLSTKKKIKLLANIKQFPIDKFEEVNELKQQFTVELLNNFNQLNTNIKNVIISLKKDGYLFYVASNAIRNTIELGLQKLGILELVDKIYSNQDVVNPKPSSEIYLKCMVEAGVDPCETVIIEDSKHGREAAVRSGAYVCGVDNSFDFTYQRISTFIKETRTPVIAWAGKSDLNVLIPMAGAGSRFAREGYLLPKPLIDVNGAPMIQTVINNLNMNANYIFVVQKEHYEKYNLKSYLNLCAPDCKIVLTDGVTEGAACTTLLTKEYINNNKHLLIANSDQFVEWDSGSFLYSMLYDDADGGILTFEGNNPKHSFVKLGSDGYVCEVAEKKIISNESTVGIYYWKSGAEYVRCAEQMINKNIRVNNEFYVAPVYNEAILKRKRIKIFRCEKMVGLGTPEELRDFLAYSKNKVN